MRYAMVVERSGASYSGYVPDLPGCVATGRTIAVVEKRLAAAVRMHIDGMREDGVAVPKPAAKAGYVSAARVRRKAG